MSDIHFTAIEGDFQRFAGSWRLQAQAGVTRVTHTVEIQPAFFAPHWLIRLLERRVMLDSIAGVIRRCQAAASPKAGQ